jgi:SAM-dependent methyltransferase
LEHDLVPKTGIHFFGIMLERQPDMRDWIEFYDSPHSIYVNARHKDVHYRDIAEQIAAFVPGPQARVLDYGCGEATHADLVAAAARQLILSDGAPAVREKIAARFAGNGKIAVLSPDEVAALPDRSVDMIVLNSVVQYLKRAELDALLALFRRLLAPTGRLVVGDVTPPDTSAVTEIMALMRLAWRNGFVGAALIGLVRTALSDYRVLRSQLGLTHYSEAEMLAALTQAGFAAQRRYPNIEHNQERMTFVASVLPAQPR